MKHPETLACVFAALSVVAVGQACAQPVEARAASPSVRALAERLPSAGARAPVGEDQLLPLCTDAADAAEVVEAALIVGVDVYTAVKDTILACGRQGNGAEVARQVATRALQLQGENVRYLIDAGVLAAAAEIARRLRGTRSVVADRSGVAEQSRAERDLERERLERMMQKGLVDEEYRRYIDERRALVESPDTGGPAADREAGIDGQRAFGESPGMPGYDYGEFFLQALPPVEPMLQPGGVSGE